MEQSAQTGLSVKKTVSAVVPSFGNVVDQRSAHRFSGLKATPYPNKAKQPDKTILFNISVLRFLLLIKIRHLPKIVISNNSHHDKMEIISSSEHSEEIDIIEIGEEVEQRREVMALDIGVGSVISIMGIDFIVADKIPVQRGRLLEFLLRPVLYPLWLKTFFAIQRGTRDFLWDVRRPGAEHILIRPDENSFIIHTNMRSLVDAIRTYRNYDARIGIWAMSTVKLLQLGAESMMLSSVLLEAGRRRKSVEMRQLLLGLSLKRPEVCRVFQYYLQISISNWTRETFVNIDFDENILLME